MKKLLTSLCATAILGGGLWFIWTSNVAAQCNGVFPPNTLCGNLGATSAPPAAFSATTSVIGPGSSTVNDLALWANTTGNQLKDGGGGTVAGNYIWSGNNTYTAALSLNSAVPIIGMAENDGTPKTFNWVLSGQVLGLRDALSFPGIITIDGTINDRVTIQHPSATNDTASMALIRTGPATGALANINSALLIQSTTSSPSAADNENGELIVMTSSMSAANAVGMYSRTIRTSGTTGKIWATVHESDDFTQGGNPTGGVLAAEMDLWAQGGDSNKLRGVLDLETGNVNVGGAAPTVTHALRIYAVNGVPTNGTFTDGIAFGPATFGTLINIESASGNLPTVTTGINLSAVAMSTAILTSSFSVDGNGNTKVGHLNGLTQATSPTAATCAGFALKAGSSDTAGTLTYTSAATCSVNFGNTYANAPACIITAGSSIASTVGVTTATTGFVVTFGTSQNALSWHCMGA